MSTKLIKLEDGTLIEVEAPESEVQQIAGGLADTVEATLDKIKPTLLKTCKTIVEAIKDIRQEIDLDQVEIELGLSFEAQGNIYITKAKAGSNITVKLTLKN